MWHHVSVTEQTSLLSVTGSNFLLSLSLPLSLPLSSVPSCSFFFPPFLPLSSSLFVLFSRTTKGRQSPGWRHPSSLQPFKKTAPASHPFLHLNRQHTHTHMETQDPWLSPQLYIGLLISFYSSAHVRTVKQPALFPFSLIHTNTCTKTHAHTEPQNWLPTRHLSTARWEVFSQTLEVKSLSLLD